MNIVGKILCSNPVAFAVGVGIGVGGLYLLSRTEEKRKLSQTQMELEEAIQALNAMENNKTEVTVEPVSEVKNKS